MLKARTERREWGDIDEQDFVHALEAQLEKIHEFQREKVWRLFLMLRECIDAYAQASELSRRIRDAERAVKRLVSDYDGEHDHGEFPGAHDANTDVEAGRHANLVSAADDAGSDDDDDDEDDLHYDGESSEALEDQFRRLEEEVATLVADVHDLALYTKVPQPALIKQVYLTF